MSERPIRRFGKFTKSQPSQPKIVPYGTTPIGRVIPEETSYSGLKDEVRFKNTIYTRDMAQKEPESAQQTAEVYQEALPLLREKYQEKKDDFTQSYKIDRMKYGAPTLDTLEIGKEVNSLDREITETENFVDAIMNWLDKMD